jgi:hypothetical protein
MEGSNQGTTAQERLGKRNKDRGLSLNLIPFVSSASANFASSVISFANYTERTTRVLVRVLSISGGIL